MTAALDSDRTLDSYGRHLEAEPYSTHTRRAYLVAARELHRHGEAEGWPGLSELRREHLTAYLAHLQHTRAPATATARRAALGVFFRWLHDEGEIPENPLEGVRWPRPKPKPVPTLTIEQCKRLLDACDGDDWQDRRDRALLRIFLDTGLRVEEMAGVKMDDVAFAPGKGGLLHVRRRKGGKEGHVPFGVKAARELDRYLRVRTAHARETCEFVWVSHYGGGLKPRTIRRIVTERGAAAGLLGLHPHLLRHTAAHLWLAADGQEGDLVEIMGWSDRSMLQRYAASRAAERAQAAHRKYGPGDQI